MTYSLTLVASNTGLPPGAATSVKDYLDSNDLKHDSDLHWLHPKKAADIKLEEKITIEQIKEIRDLLENDKVDVFFMPETGRKKKLIIADMDSTIVEGETLDEIADQAGIKDKIAPITEKAMKGEIDFKQALRERVSLLKGLPEKSVQQVLETTNLNPGAQIFVQVMKNNGAASVLVSGGFTLFTNKFGNLAGFNYNHGNMLQIENGELTGKVMEPILDKESKVHFLKSYTADLNLAADDVLAIGDGANDLPMLKMAGLGIGFHPKPLLKDELMNCIIHGDLCAALYAQGYTEKDIQNCN
jgi:phosphoserine phosphatase